MEHWDFERKYGYFQCQCKSIEHILQMTFYKDDHDSDKMLYVEVHLRQVSFLKRVWHAIKYVFGYRSRFGDFEEFLWDADEAEKFRDMINTFLEMKDKNEI